MRTSLCIDGQHRACGGQANRGTTERPRLVDCSCSCHKKRGARTSTAAPMAGTIRRWVLERDGYRCRAEVEGICTGEPDHPHHLLQKSVGGKDEEANLLTVCWRCHDWIHDNIAEAEKRGLLRRSTGRPTPSSGDIVAP